MKIRMFRAALLLGLMSQPAYAVDPVKGNPPPGYAAEYMKRPNLNRPGLGEDEGRPRVTPFELPAGVRIAGQAVGADMDGRCPDGKDRPGVARNVQICVPVCTIGNLATNITFPPGLIITTTAETFQHGVLVTREVVAVPPVPCNAGPASLPEKRKRKLTAEENGGEESTELFEIPSWDPASLPKHKVHWIKLSTFCLNEGRDPSAVEGTYEIAGVTADPDLLDLARFASGRNLSDPDDNQVVQTAVYSITEAKGLTWQDRKDLHEIPAL